MEEWISPLRSSLNDFFDEPPDDHVWINAGRLSDLYHSYDVSRCVRCLKINMSSDVSREFEHTLEKHDVDLVEIDTWV